MGRNLPLFCPSLTVKSPTHVKISIGLYTLTQCFQEADVLVLSQEEYETENSLKEKCVDGECGVGWGRDGASVGWE